MCRHSDIVDLTTLHVCQETGDVVGVTADHRALVGHGLNTVGAGTSGCGPMHLGRAHVVLDRHIRGNTGLWGSKEEASDVTTGVVVLGGIQLGDVSTDKAPLPRGLKEKQGGQNG